MINVLKFQIIYAIIFFFFFFFFFCLNFAFFQLFHKILSEKANSLDPDQIASEGAILSEILVFEILGHLP